MNLKWISESFLIIKGNVTTNALLLSRDLGTTRFRIRELPFVYPFAYLLNERVHKQPQTACGAGRDLERAGEPRHPKFSNIKLN